MSTPFSPPGAQIPRPRMQRDDRKRQLLETAWTIVREEGTDSLSLVRLAERAGITKPVVYDHFRTRNGLLSVMYQEFDIQQTQVMDDALAHSQPTLSSRANVIASAYVDCVLKQGQEIPDLIAALAGSPEMAELKRNYQLAFIEKCRGILAPFSAGGDVEQSKLWAMLGAADGVSNAAACGDISDEEAKNELSRVVVSTVE